MALQVKCMAPYALDVPALRRVVEPNEVVEVDEDTARGMVGQDETWEPQGFTWSELDPVPADETDETGEV